MSKPDLVFLTKENESSIKERIKPLLEESEREREIEKKLSDMAQATYEKAVTDAKARFEKDKQNEINNLPISIDVTI